MHPPQPCRGGPEEKRLSTAPGEPTTLPCSWRMALLGESLTTAAAQRHQEQGPWDPAT